MRIIDYADEASLLKIERLSLNAVYMVESCTLSKTTSGSY
jgi:hypothetical protein